MFLCLKNSSKLVTVFALGAVIHILRTELNVIDGHIERATFQNLTEAQPVFLVCTQILLNQDAAHVVAVSTERLGRAAIAVHGLHKAAVTHGLVNGFVLFLIVGVRLPASVTVEVTETDGDTAGFVVQIDLGDASVITGRIAQAHLIGTIVRYRWQFHGSIKLLTGDTDTATLIVAPAGLFVTATYEGMRVVHLKVGQETVLETDHLLFLIHIIYTRAGVHEVRTETTAVDTNAAVDILATHSQQWLFGYKFGYELLIVNGLLVFGALMVASEKEMRNEE